MTPTTPLDSRAGDAYVYTWPSYRVRLEIDEVRESHGELYGEITVYDLGEDHEQYHMSGPTRHGLLGPNSRRDLAKLLSERVEAQRGIPWSTLVEQAFVLTVRKERQGEPAICLNGTGGPVLVRRMLLGDQQYPFLAERETTMLYADGGGGKGYLALQVAMSLATGQPLAEMLLPQGEPVQTLYCDWETHEAAIDRRWSRVAQAFGAQPRPPLHYLRMTRPLVNEAGRVRRQLAETGAQFVIIDSIGFAAETDLTTAEAATRLFGVCNSFGCTVLLLHHMSKDAVKQKRGQAESYGTVYFRLATRNAWEMRTDEYGPDDLLLGLWHIKANEGRMRRQPIGLRLHFEGDEGPVSLLRGDVRASKVLNERRPLGDRLVDLLGKEARTLRDCLKPLELDEEKLPSLQVTANRLLMRGKLLKLDDDRWGVPAEGEGQVVQFPETSEDAGPSDDVPF